MDYDLRSSYDAGLVCSVSSTGNVTLALAVVDPISHELVDSKLRPTPATEDYLTTALTELVESEKYPICATAVAVPQDIDDARFHTIRTSAFAAELPIAGSSSTLIDAACVYYTLVQSSVLAERDSSMMLCVQLGAGEGTKSYAALMKLTRARKPEAVSESLEHTNTSSPMNGVDLVQALVTPLIKQADHILLVPSAASSVLDNFIFVLPRSTLSLPILRPSLENLAHGMAIRSSIYTKTVLAKPTVNPPLVVPIGILTASGKVVTVLPAGRTCPTERTLTLQTAKDDQPTVSVNLVVGVPGGTVLQDSSQVRKSIRVILHGISSPTNGRVLIKVRALVKKSYDVAISVEPEGGAGVVEQCPGLLRRIRAITKAYEASEKKDEVDMYENIILGELGE